MTCKRIARDLPLFVGRDLEPSRMAGVAAHLAECERCRSLQTELAGSRAWLEASPAPPVSEGDFAAMRREVWRRIETGAGKPAGAGPGRVVLASAGLLAAAFVAVLLLRARPEVPRPASQTASASASGEETVVRTPPAKTKVIEEPSLPPAPVRVARHNPRKPVRPSGREAESSVARIEFQTANPDVRIIWLVKKGEAAPATRPASRNEEVS